MGRTRTLRVSILVAISVAIVAGLAAFGVWRNASRSVDQAIVVGVRTDEQGTQVPAFIARVRLDEAGARSTTVDTGREVVVAGAPAATLSDAFVYGGAAQVARLAASGQSSADWVLVPESQWKRLVDEAGGIAIDLPKELAIFDGDRLLELEAGRVSLSGDDAATLLVGLDALPAADRTAVRLRTEELLAKIVLANPSQMLEASRHDSSLSSIAAPRIDELERRLQGDR